MPMGLRMSITRIDRSPSLRSSLIRRSGSRPSRAVPRRIFSSVQRYPRVPLLRRSTAGETPGWGSERVENGIREFEGVRESYSMVLRSSSQGCTVDLTGFLAAWRTTSLPDREVVDALVHPAHAGPSPALAAALAHAPGSYYWSDEPDGRHLVLTRPLARRRERWVPHLVLFLVTLYTITFAGAVLAGAIPYTGPLVFFTSGHPGYPGFLHAWSRGLPFSLPLMAILLTHELGHYVVARRYQLDVSPPYFVPVPMFPTFIGTMGAFIRLRTIVSDRRQLLDIGVAGPIAGFLVALPVLVCGLALSHPVAAEEGFRGLVVFFGDAPQIPLGDSLASFVLRRLLVGDAAMINVHPVALAGWGGLVLLLSRGRLGHPPVLDAQRPLPPSRRTLAWAAVLLFVVTFAPVPFRL